MGLLGTANLWAGLESFGTVARDLLGDFEFSNNSFILSLTLAFKRQERA